MRLYVDGLREFKQGENKTAYKINFLIRFYDAVLSFLWSRGIVVGTLTRLQAGRSLVRIPVDTRDFSLLHYVQTGSGAYPDS